MVLVQELNRDIPDADHEQHLVRDNLDDGSAIIIACDGEVVIGTQRLTLGVSGLLEDWCELFQMPSVAKSLYPNSISMSSRLAVLPEYRKSTVPMRLAVRCYQAALEGGSCFDFSCAKPERAAYLNRLGYLQYGTSIEIPGTGPVLRFAIPAHLQSHLRDVRSPFLKYAPQCLKCRSTAVGFTAD